MKNFFKTLLLLLFISSSLCLFPQSDKNYQPKSKFKHSIGVQINSYIYLDNISMSIDFPRIVYALRYGYRFDNFTLGLELFDWTHKNHSSKGNTIGLGVYSRYHFLQSKKAKPFVELNGYYAHSKTEIYDTSLFLDGRNETVNNRFSYFVAPGISINLYKNRLTLDLMVKMSTERLQSGNHFDPSYKIVFHF